MTGDDMDAETHVVLGKNQLMFWAIVNIACIADMQLRH